MSNLKDFKNVILFLIGGALVCLAIAIPSGNYSTILLGPGAKDLSWGPALFRILLSIHGVLLIAVALFRKNSKKNVWQAVEINSKNKNLRDDRVALIGLLVLSVIALALRLWNLNSDLWVDEVFTLLDFARQPFGQILTSFPSQNQHMFFSILAHASLQIFGESAWALRLPSVLFGVGSIWAFFLLCRHLLDTRQALLACALMTVSYHHVWFSQNARGYMGLLFFTLLATWLWFEALEKNKWSWWFGYAAAAILGMWIHMTMAFVIAAHGLVHLAFLISPKLSGNDHTTFSPERRAGIKPIAAWMLVLTGTLQLYALALPEFLSVGLHEESKNSEWTNPLWVLTESITSLSIGFAGVAVVVCGAAFVAFGWYSLFRKNKRSAILMVLPPIFAGVFMLSLGHNLFPRFFFFAMGFGLLIVIHGAIELPKTIFGYVAALRPRKNIASFAGVALAILMIIVSLVTVPRNYALPKQNFTGAKDFVESHKTPADPIVAVGIAGMIYGNYFAPQWSVAKTDSELKNLEQKNERIWLVYTLAPEIKAFRPEMWQTIQNDYEIVRVFPGTLNGGEIFVCQRRNINEANNESSRNSGQSENDSVWQTAYAK